MSIIQDNDLTSLNSNFSIIQQSDLDNINFSFKTNAKYYATQMLKSSVDIGKAVVKILGTTGIAGFKFNLPQGEQLQFSTDITDNYVDNNRVVQDHAANGPVQITMQGLCGDYFYSVNQIEDMLAKVTPTMALVKQFLPKLPSSTKQFLAKKYQSINNTKTLPKALQAEDDVNFNRIDLWALAQDVYKIKSNQTRSYFFLKSLWQANARFSVETTWERFDNMMITNLKILREENLDITDFSVSFKQIDFTQSLSRSLNNKAGRTREQLSQISKKGVDKGKKVSAI